MMPIFRCSGCGEEEDSMLHTTDTCIDNLKEQKATLRSLMREMGRILEAVASHEGMGYYDVFDYNKKKAQEILNRPEVRKILEETG